MRKRQGGGVFALKKIALSPEEIGGAPLINSSFLSLRVAAEAATLAALSHPVRA